MLASLSIRFACLDGIFKNYTQHGKTFDRLNIHYDYRDMATDGFGFMYAYNLTNSFVRISWISYWELNKADGWDLISK